MRLLLIFLAVFFLTGCSKEITAEDMPAIVFARADSAYAYDEEYLNSNDGFPDRTVFIDNKGDIFRLEKYFFTENTPEIIRDFEEGRLKDKVKLIGRCDVEEVLQNYKKILEIMKDKNFKLIDPTEAFPVEDGSSARYGVYYEEDKIVIKKLYGYSNGATYESEDERVKEILDWLYDKINQKE